MAFSAAFAEAFSSFAACEGRGVSGVVMDRRGDCVGGVVRGGVGWRRGYRYLKGRMGEVRVGEGGRVVWSMVCSSVEVMKWRE